MREASDSTRRPSLLGQRLVALGLLDPGELRQVLDLQSRLPESEPVRRLGSLLVQSGRLSMRQLADALGAQRQMLPSSGVTTQVPLQLQGVLPTEILWEVGAAPLCLIGKTLAVAMIDANNVETVARLQALTAYHVRPMQAPQLQVHRLLQSIAPRPALAPAAPRSAAPVARPAAPAMRPAPRAPQLVAARPAPAPPPRRRSLQSQTMFISIVVWATVALAGLAAAGLHIKLRHSVHAAGQSR